MQAPAIRIGTRGSPLALAQAHEVQGLLAKAHGLANERISITVIKTSGDQILDRPLAEIGGKGLFTKEIEDALLAHTIDVAVHSMKDMQTALPRGLRVGAVLPREDVRDAFISLKYKTLADVPAGSTIGTSSLRRQAQLLNARPDLHVIGFRGNVQTRLKKLQDGVADATFLAVAGLNRLGMSERVSEAVAVEQMLPAVAQGAIGLEIRDDDAATAIFIAPLNSAETALAVTAERAFLAELEGSCRTPIAGYARLDHGLLNFRGQVLSPDGKKAYAVQRNGPPGQALQIGIGAAREVLALADPEILVKTSA